MQSGPPLPPEDQPDAETRAVIERAERAWRLQAEREERALADSGRMTPFRWIVLAIAAASLLVLLVQNWLGRG